MHIHLLPNREAAESSPGPLAICPHCGGTELQQRIDMALVNLQCADCGACWHAGATFADEVDPNYCITCSERDDCINQQLVDGGFVDVNNA